MNQRKNTEQNHGDFEKNAEALALGLADKLEKNEISLTEMVEVIDGFLINPKNGENQARREKSH